MSLPSSNNSFWDDVNPDEAPDSVDGDNDSDRSASVVYVDEPDPFMEVTDDEEDPMENSDENENDDEDDDDGEDSDDESIMPGGMVHVPALQPSNAVQPTSRPLTFSNPIPPSQHRPPPIQSSPSHQNRTTATGPAGIAFNGTTSTANDAAVVASSAPGTPPTVSPVIRRRRRVPTSTASSPVTEEKTNSTAAAHQPDTEADEANTCLICLEPWCTSGPHQICCLPCGHLFGSHCIMDWLRAGRDGKRPCPTCKHPARIRQVRLLFGLPSHFSAADVTQSTALRTELKKERDSHESTMRKYRTAKREITSLRGALRSATQGAGVRAFGSSASSAIAPGGGLGSMSRMGGHVGTATTGMRIERRTRRLRLLISRLTGGGTGCATFDPSGTLLFAERANTTEMRVTRLSLARGAAVQHASDTARRINAVAACKATEHPDFRRVAVACQERMVRVLSPDLLPSGFLSLPSPATAVAWGAGFGVLAGMMSGEIALYDTRNLTRGPVWRAHVGVPGQWRTVHSIAAMDDGWVVAAAPVGVFAGRPSSANGRGVEFASVGPENGRAVSGVSVAGRMIAVSAAMPTASGSVASQSNGLGEAGRCVSVHAGLRGGRISNATGDVLLAGNGTVRAGMRFGAPAVVGDLNDECIVAVGDPGMRGGVRAWSYGRRQEGDIGWNSVEVETDAVEADGLGNVGGGCVGFPLPSSARIDGVPVGTSAVIASFADGAIRVFGL